MFDCILDTLPSGTAILLSLAIILLAGFLMTRITKLLKLPNVSGYIIAGIIIGPNVLNLIPSQVSSGMGFFSDIALAFIAFGVGRFFKKDTLRETGPHVILITVFETLLAGVLV
ncbi:MAG: cation:proton antiporter, partial [Eubacteriales bacterium]